MVFRNKRNGLGFWETYFGGSINLGAITFYGENAMHWAINIKTNKWGYVCFRLPFRCFGQWWPVYFYVSPNATPWASTFYRGPEKSQIKLADGRRRIYGHNFDPNLLNTPE